MPAIISCTAGLPEAAACCCSMPSSCWRYSGLLRGRAGSEQGRRKGRQGGRIRQQETAAGGGRQRADVL